MFPWPRPKVASTKAKPEEIFGSDEGADLGMEAPIAAAFALCKCPDWELLPDIHNLFSLLSGDSCLPSSWLRGVLVICDIDHKKPVIGHAVLVQPQTCTTKG